ncbi:phage portal protein [Ochrobactrum sp. A-1]|uniref:phage portal protein n=1 Tax=Ochrobactrum sp. A-1 TaxID=2920940 RepID=UPI001F0B0A97|nr:phage portal protein [Ochrobactrum sp. A-1]
MDILNIFRRKTQATAPQVHAQSDGQFIGFDDPRFKEWMRNGGDGVASPMSIKEAMRNTAVFRCVSLISYSIGMLPMHVIDTETKEKARESGLFSLLHSMPNDWQTAFNFRQYMQRNALVHGNAYALIVRSMDRVIRLVPLDPTTIRVKQNRDWSVVYEYTPKQGELRILKPKDVLHVYADSDDGICGTSMVKIAANAIDLARELETSQRRLFKNDMHLGGALLHPNKLSPEAYERLKTSMNEQYGGSENAGKWMIAEEGMKPEPFTGSAKDSQQIESRSMQIEEIGRAFGVPRPFLGVDDTSWGSGIDVLGQIFVRYALNPWFTAWEQAVKRSCMTDKEREQYDVKFNAGALLRGSMKDQADFFAKALGSGGHQPWMDYEEVRETMDLPEKDIAPNPLAQKGNGNEPQNPA